jgi:DNA polymerase IIIc chi subunit
VKTRSSLEGKRVLVVCRDPDHASPFATAMAKEGARIVLYGQDGPSMGALAATIWDAGGWVKIVHGDAADPCCVVRLVESDGGPVDLVVGA